MKTSFAARSVLAFLLLAQPAIVPGAFCGVLQWNREPHGIVPTVPELRNVAALIGGYDWGLALHSNGTLTAWGNIELPNDLSNVSSLSHNAFQVYALQNGKVVAIRNATAPPAALAGVRSVACGPNYGLAVLNDGVVTSWGNGYYGQTEVPSSLTGVRSIVAGWRCAAAVQHDGRVVTWGGKDTESSREPVSPPHWATNMAAIQLCDDQGERVETTALALTFAGKVLEWDVYTGEKKEIPSDLTNVVSISAQGSSRLALRSDGTVARWGAPGPSRIAGASLIAATSNGGLVYGDSPVASPFSPSILDSHDGVLSLRTVFGTKPFVYQWLFNGSPLPNATNAALVLAETVSGVFSVIVSNQVGNWTANGHKVLGRVKPRNDDFAAAQPLPAYGGRVFGSLLMSTPEPLEPRHGGAASGRTVWFQWTAPAQSQVTLDTIGTEVDTLVAVYTGESLTNLKVVAVDDDGAQQDLASKLSFSAIAGQTYRIVIVALGQWSGYGYYQNDDWDDAAQGWSTRPLDWELVNDTSIALNLEGVPPALAISSGASGVVLSATGYEGRTIITETSENLREWFPISTNKVPQGGVIRFENMPSQHAGSRFFRGIIR